MRIMGIFLFVLILNIIIAFYTSIFALSDSNVYKNTRDMSNLIFGDIFSKTSELSTGDPYLQLADVLVYYIPLGLRILLLIPLIGPLVINYFIVDTVTLASIPFSGMISAISTTATIVIYLYYIIMVMTWIRGTQID